jgi:hypothetical protein
LIVQWAKEFKTVIEILKIFADDEAEAGPEEVAAITGTATEGVEPLEAMLTPEVVGNLGPEVATLALQLQELMLESA